MMPQWLWLAHIELWEMQSLVDGDDSPAYSLRFGHIGREALSFALEKRGQSVLSGTSDDLPNPPMTSNHNVVLTRILAPPVLRLSFPQRGGKNQDDALQPTGVSDAQINCLSVVVVVAFKRGSDFDHVATGMM